MKCLSAEDMMDYLRGAVSPHTSAEIGAHFNSGCPVCFQQRQWLVSTLDVTLSDQSYDLPAVAINRVVDWFKQQSEDNSGVLRRLAAQLIFDSLQPTHMAPVRSGLAGAGAAAGRQVLYRADGYDIDLRFEGGEDTDDEDLIGQILSGHRPPKTPNRLPVRLLREEMAIANALANARGVFKFARIRSGIYDLQIDAPEGEILISRIATARAV